jgi:hypothetical protein
MRRIRQVNRGNMLEKRAGGYFDAFAKENAEPQGLDRRCE